MKVLSDAAIAEVMGNDGWSADMLRAIAQASQRDTLRQVVALLPNIPERFDHNKTCFDCIGRLKQELGEEKND